MPLRKSLSLLSLILLSSIITSCGSVPDVYVCKELNPGRAFCTKTITDENQYVDDEHKLNGKTWWEIRPTTIQMPPESWAEFKKWIIKTCRRIHCRSDIGQWLKSVEDRVPTTESQKLYHPRDSPYADSSSEI